VFKIERVPPEYFGRNLPRNPQNQNGKEEKGIITLELPGELELGEKGDNFKYGGDGKTDSKNKITQKKKRTSFI